MNSEETLSPQKQQTLDPLEKCIEDVSKQVAVWRDMSKFKQFNFGIHLQLLLVAKILRKDYG